MKNEYNLEYLHGTFRNIYKIRWLVDEPIACDASKIPTHIHFITLNKIILTLWSQSS